MRKPQELVHSRTRVTSRYALMPLEGFPVSRLPSCPEAEVRVLASPALGAEFVQMLIDLPKDKTFRATAGEGIESFYLVLSGTGNLREGKSSHELKSGAFSLLPPGTSFE